MHFDYCGLDYYAFYVCICAPPLQLWYDYRASIAVKA